MTEFTSVKAMKVLKRVGSLRMLPRMMSLFVAIQTGMGLTSIAAEDAVDPATLRHLAGHWYVSLSEPTVYYYKDAEQFVDLFTYHRKDSNKDGVENIVLSHNETHLFMDSQGYPNHPTAIFPNSGNPNRIEIQKFRFQLPLQPKLNDHITRLPMGPIGTAVNGVVYFNPFEIGGMNAVEGYSEVWLDSCCGHPQQTGIYHYHKYPVCVKSPFKDNGKQHSPIIGFAFDGFPIYGPYESDGLMAKDATGELTIDACNGHTDSYRGYHYHVTPGRFPYIVGGYAGVPEMANLHGRRGLESGAIENNSSGESLQPKVIMAVRPASGLPGTTQKLEIELNPAMATRTPVPDGTPDWVQVGPYEAVSIKRTGNRLQVEIEIPADATLGVLMDCHIEFKTSNRFRAVFKRNDVFRVVDNPLL